MDLYIYTKRKDVAATTLADLADYIAALDAPSVAANVAIISRVADSVESFVQGDSGEALNLFFSEDGTTYINWSTDSSVTLSVGLGDQDPRQAYTYSSSTSFPVSGNGRVGTLALNTTALRDAIERASQCRGRATGIFVYLHIRKTSATGVTETVSLLPVQVQAGVLVSGTVDDSAAASYITRDTFVVSGIRHVAGVTSLTGGGDAALDGIDAQGTDYPVGCVIITSDGDIGRWWKLKGSNISASDVDAGLVKPTNGRAVHWKAI